MNTNTDMTPRLDQAVYDKLLMIKLYEQKIKELKADLQSQVAKESSVKTPMGKVTHTVSHRATIDGKAIYSALVRNDQNPLNWGECSVKVTETDIERMISQGIVTTEEAEGFISEKRIETVRITPTKDAKEQFNQMLSGYSPTHLLLSNED